MDGSHEALYDAEVVVDDLGKRSQTVGGAGCVGNNRHVLGVGVMVYAHYEHGSVLAGGGYDDLLRACLQVLGSALDGGVDTAALKDILCAALGPGDIRRVHAGIYGNGLAVYHQLVSLYVYGALKTAMDGIILEHIAHIIQCYEGIVDAHYFYVIVFNSGAKSQTADTAETVNAHFY